MDPAANQDDLYLRVHAVRVFVRDQERSLRFYVDQLGFKLAFDAQLPYGQRWLAVAPPDGSTVLSRSAPPATGAAASASSADREPVWGAVFTRFEDLDGNSFALVSFDEESRAVEAQRRRMAEKLESERRTAHELEIARKVQARLFPQTFPPSGTPGHAGVGGRGRPQVQPPRTARRHHADRRQVPGQLTIIR